MPVACTAQLGAGAASGAVAGAVLGLLLTAALSLLLLWCTAVIAVARMRLRPPRMTDGKALYRLKRVSPADLDLPYETVSFEVPGPREDSLQLKGWWIPAAADSPRTVIVLHGYADAKVGVLPWAAFLHAAGFNTLLYDARAHGESDGRHCTAGFFERHDLLEVLRQTRASRPAATARLAVLGISMGGVTALAAGAMGMDVDAIVVDSVFSDYSSAGVLHASLFGLPGPGILHPATWLAQHFSGARFAAVRPLDTIRQQHSPVLLIQPAQDRVIHDEAAARLRTGLMESPAGARSKTVVIPGASHVTGLLAQPDFYRETVLEFLQAAMAGSPGVSPA